MKKHALKTYFDTLRLQHFPLKHKGRGPSDLEPLSPLTFFVLFARFEKLQEMSRDEKHIDIQLARAIRDSR